MDDNLTKYLQCDVELTLSGPSVAVLNKWAADTLRAVADRIEQGGFKDGHHEVKDRVGKPVGTAYFDYTEGDDS